MKKILLALCMCVTTMAWADTSALAGSAAQSAAMAGSLSNASQGNAQNITINGAPNPAQTTQRLEGTSTVKMAPQVYAPPMGVTAPCRVALSAGVSVIGVGVAAGGSVADSPCNLRELSRLYQGIGQTEKAVAVADGALMLECSDEAVAAALGDICKTAKQRPATRVSEVAQPAPKVAALTCQTTISDSGIKTTTCPN